MTGRLDSAAVLGAVRRVVGEGGRPVALHEPCFGGNEWAYIKECLDTGWVSSVGSFVDRFEEALAAYTGVRHAVATVNGTAALHVALQLAGVGPGDEVIVPALTFVATANAVAYCGAIPHFADSEERTLGLDARCLAEHLAAASAVRSGSCVNRGTGRPIRAVVAMHTFGHPVDLDALSEVCEHFGLALVEDAAEALGSLYKGRHAGSFGRLSALSFNGNKIITTGGGGAILTDDPELARRAKHLTTTARLAHAWEIRHDEVGYNYRLPNLNAALGCAQVERLPGLVAKKRALAERYAEALAGVPGVRFFREPAFATSNYWLNAILLDEDCSAERDRLLGAMNEGGILARPAWTLMHRLPMFVDCPRTELTVSESLERRLVNLPSSASLGDACEP